MLEHRARIIAIALLCVAFGSEALTLGRVRGAALVGQPLDMAVQVQVDAGEDASSLCFEAEVFHADTRQDASRVRVLVEATAQPHTANVRILSSALVDEPVVTVYLRAGCGQKTSRRYVLLADLPSEVAAPVAPLVVPASAPAKVDVTRAVPVSVAQASTVQVPKQTVRRGVDNKRPAVKAGVASSKGARPGEESKGGRSAGQSRLKLDPLDLLSDRIENLDAFMTFTPPEDALRNMQKTLALEADVKALLALSVKNEASVMDLKARLQKAESERFPGGLIYGLLGLVLACLAGVAFLWNRQRRAQAAGGDWWSGSISMPAVPETEPEPPLGPVTARKELIKASAVDVSMIEMSESNFDDIMQSGAARSASRKQPPSASPAVAPQTRRTRSLNSTTTLDIRQQAEFFVSLGQTEQAVRILKKQINESDEPNPFVYLDLLGILHSLSLKIDFQRVRESFTRLFSARVPEFAVFKDEGRDLESYADVLSRITALWPTPKVLEMIEACIFQDPRDGDSQSFDLAAFRDLLLLHAVAQGTVPVRPREGREPGVDSSSSVGARASTPFFFADSGSAVPAPTGVHGLSVSMQPDLSLDEIRLAPALDLDLSDSEPECLADGSVSAADVDLPLPLLMPDDHEVDGQGEDVPRALDDGNLINFDMPETPTPPGRR